MSAPTVNKFRLLEDLKNINSTNSVEFTATRKLFQSHLGNALLDLRMSKPSTSPLTPLYLEIAIPDSKGGVAHWVTAREPINNAPKPLASPFRWECSMNVWDEYVKAANEVIERLHPSPVTQNHGF